MLAVADGMGGASAGEYASRMTLNLLSHAYFASPNSTVPKAMRSAVETANAKVFEESEVNPALSGMGTTCSALVVHGSWAYIAQVGDSRVYLLRERSGIHQLTYDHSLVAEQVRSGLISEEEARTHTLKNLITRAVGIKGAIKVDLFSIELQRGDTLLICSDGLSNMVSDEQISETLSIGDLRTNAHELVNLALAGGGTDNITAVVMRVIDTPPRVPLQEGAQGIELTPSGIFSRLRRLFS
jgi:protein phosphatase